MSYEISINGFFLYALPCRANDEIDAFDTEKFCLENARVVPMSVILSNIIV